MANPIIESTQASEAIGMRGIVVKFDTADGDVRDVLEVSIELSDEDVITEVTAWASDWMGTYNAVDNLIGTELDLS